MKHRLVIIGAGGHGKVVSDIALDCGYRDIVFIDDNAKGKCLQFPIIGTCCSLDAMNDGLTDFIIAIGNNEIRKEIAESFRLNWCTLIHSSAQLSPTVKIAHGTVVMPGSIVNSCAEIGRHCIINTAAIVEHDNIIGDYVNISPKVTLGGTVHIGMCTHVGIGATVRNNIDICSNCFIGAGATVVKNIESPGLYIGIPAKMRTWK